MNKYPYMPLYWNDLFSDNKVRVMSNEELGAYIRLLGVAWHETVPGTLPADEDDLARLANLELAAWTKISGRVLACFVLDRRSGRYVQKRMVKEYKKLCECSNKRRKAGAIGNAKRWKRENNDPSHCDDFASRKTLADASLSGSKVLSEDNTDKPPGCELPLPENLANSPGFVEAWELLCTHQCEIKKPFRRTSGSRMLAKLAEHPECAVTAINRIVDNNWRTFDWRWLDNSPSASIKAGQAARPALKADEAALGNARMAFYSASGRLPFGMSDDDLLAWFSKHLAVKPAA